MALNEYDSEKEDVKKEKMISLLYQLAKDVMLVWWWQSYLDGDYL